jgi:CDP-diacylglycerol---glycerol-3-phosphate 3-phosphatidyltransferase
MTFPNQLSVLRIILSPVFFLMFMSDNIILKRLSIVVFIVAILTDWYDGWHARKFKSVSKFGMFLDPLADKILTSFSFLLFYMLEIVPLWMIVLIIFRDLIITSLRFYDELKGHTMDTSFLAKVKTFTQMTYIFIVLFFLSLLTYDIGDGSKYIIAKYLSYSNPVNYFLMLFITILTVYTGITYFFQKKSQELEANKKEKDN